ncbi:Peroxisomal membrane signal receptor PTS1, partial [Clydaea vesicula]
MADCSTGSSLQMLSKQLERDSSLHQDSFSQKQERRQINRTGDFSENLVNDFIQQNRPENFNNQNVNANFQFRQMGNELHNILDSRGSIEHLQDGWANEFEKFKAHPINGDFSEMENAYKQYQKPVNWNSEFLENKANFDKQHFNERDTAVLEEAWSEQFATVEESFEKAWKGKEADTTTWDKEFEELISTPGALQDPMGNVDWAEQFQQTWKEVNGGADPDWQEDFDQYLSTGGFNESLNMNELDPVTGPLLEYTFETENPYLSHPDPLSEATKLLNSGTTLSAAALALEAAVQQNPKNSDAWMQLGILQAENEKETPAMSALQHAVKENPLNEKALLSLSVSYTNENMDVQAFATLERWFKITYPSIVESKPIAESVTSTALHARITDLFLEAARLGGNLRVGGEVLHGIDPDVQVGLGVLFYNSHEYEKAIDCFNAALSARPEDYRLWNKLGATLANSGQSELAIDAYYKALEINPTYVRGRYNLGVSCINIGCFKEAAEHLLGALSMHVIHEQSAVDNDGNPVVTNVSKTLWDTLRRTFILMDRRDLSDRALISQ